MTQLPLTWKDEEALITFKFRQLGFVKRRAGAVSNVPAEYFNKDSPHIGRAGNGSATLLAKLIKGPHSSGYQPVL